MWSAAHLFVRIFTRMNDGKFCAFSTIDKHGEGVRFAAVADNGRVFDCLQTEQMMEIQKAKVCRGLNMQNITWLTFFEMIQQAFVDRSISLEFANANAAAAAGGIFQLNNNSDAKSGTNFGGINKTTSASGKDKSQNNMTTSSAATEGASSGSSFASSTVWYRNNNTPSTSTAYPIKNSGSGGTGGGAQKYMNNNNGKANSAGQGTYGSLEDGESASSRLAGVGSLTSLEDPDVLLTLTVKSLNQLQSDNRTTQIVFALKQTRDAAIVRIASDITSFVGLRTGDRREMERVDELLRSDRVARNDTITTRECFDILSGSVTALHCEIETLQNELQKTQVELEKRAQECSSSAPSTNSSQQPNKSDILDVQRLFEAKCSTDALLYHTEDPLRGFAIAPRGATLESAINTDDEAVKRVTARTIQEAQLNKILEHQLESKQSQQKTAEDNSGRSSPMSSDLTNHILANNYYCKTAQAPPRELSGEHTEILPPDVDPSILLELRKAAMMNVMPQDGVFSSPSLVKQQQQQLQQNNGENGDGNGDNTNTNNVPSFSSPTGIDPMGPLSSNKPEYGFKAFSGFTHTTAPPDWQEIYNTAFPGREGRGHEVPASASLTNSHGNNNNNSGNTGTTTPGGTVVSNNNSTTADEETSGSKQSQQDNALQSPLTPHSPQSSGSQSKPSGGFHQGPPSSQIVKTIKRDTDLVDSLDYIRELSMEHVELIQYLTEWLGDWKFNVYHVEALCSKAAGAHSPSQKFTTDPKKISPDLPLAPPGALFYVGYLVFLKLHLIRQFSMSERKVIAWLRAIEMGYRQSGAPFHSSSRAADVLQAIFCLIAADTKRNVFNDRFALILVLSAILSHYRHPGNLEVLPKSLLETFGPCGALQRHHVAAGYALFEYPEYDIFDQVSDGSKRLIHEYVGNIIVSSDLAVHDTTMSTLRLKLASMDLGMFIQTESCLFLSIILKLASVVFTARECDPFAVAVKDLLAEARGERLVDPKDDLKRMSMITMQSLDNPKLEAEEESISSLLNLINTIALPLFSTMGEIFPSVRTTGQHILANKTYASSLRS